MGQTCGCADSDEPRNEFKIEEDEIRQRMHEQGSGIDEQTLQWLIKNVHLIVRVQAFYRGHLLRKRINAMKTRGLRAPRSLMSYQSNDTNTVLGAGQLPSAGEDADLEFRPEHTFENGAVYKG